MGQLIISIVMFNSYVANCQRVPFGSPWYSNLATENPAPTAPLKDPEFPSLHELNLFQPAKPMKAIGVSGVSSIHMIDHDDIILRHGCWNCQRIPKKRKLAPKSGPQHVDPHVSRCLCSAFRIPPNPFRRFWTCRDAGEHCVREKSKPPCFHQTHRIHES